MYDEKNSKGQLILTGCSTNLRKDRCFIQMTMAWTGVYVGMPQVKTKTPWNRLGMPEHFTKQDGKSKIIT